MKSRVFSFLGLALLTLFAMPSMVVQAANTPVIDVNVQGVARQSLTLSGLTATGAGGQAFFNTLQNDLQRCGWYRLAANGQVKVTGSVFNGNFP